MKRKFLAMALSVMVALGCMACGGGAEGDAPAGEAAADETTVPARWWWPWEPVLLPWTRVTCMKNIRH